MIRRSIAASVVIISLTSCSGTVESTLEGSELASGEVNVQGTVQTSTPTTVVVTTTAPSPETTVPIVDEQATSTTAPEATLPGNGAALSEATSTLEAWNYRPAEKWNQIDGTDAEAQIWETTTGQIVVHSIDVPDEIVAERRGQLEEAVTAEFGNVKVYGGDYYYHTGGYEAIWLRFDWVQVDAWTSVQRYWIIDDGDVLEITLTGNDPQAFEEELFLLQGVINEISHS